MQLSGVKSHNSIGVGERNDGPLRRVYRKVTTEHPRIDQSVSLRISVKSCNDTLGHHGLMPTLLVFGELPALPLVDQKNLNQKERMKAPRCEMDTITAENRIKKALRSRLQPATRYHIVPGDLVRVYREDSRKWVGPVQVTRVDHKIIYVTDGVKTKAFNRVQNLPVRTNNPSEDEQLTTVYGYSENEQAKAAQELNQCQKYERKIQHTDTGGITNAGEIMRHEHSPNHVPTTPTTAADTPLHSPPSTPNPTSYLQRTPSTDSTEEEGKRNDPPLPITDPLTKNRNQLERRVNTRH